MDKKKLINKDTTPIMLKRTKYTYPEIDRQTHRFSYSQLYPYSANFKYTGVLVHAHT